MRQHARECRSDNLARQCGGEEAADRELPMRHRERIANQREADWKNGGSCDARQHAGCEKKR
jgi:hypothetical protein